MNTQEQLTAAGIVFVEIDGKGVESGRTYQDKGTGAIKPLPGRQTGYIWQGGKYPVEVSLEYPDREGPYRPGFYLLGGPVFASGDYGRLQFKGTRELALIPAELLLDGAALGKKAA